MRKVVLDNGIRVVMERIPSVKSVSIGLWVNVGSRDESTDEHGLSHFLEHMFFKGTPRRSAKEIALEIDVLGGEVNAFTSKETTTFYARVLGECLPQAVDILSDNFHCALFDSGEIEKERRVVMEEIKMVEDDPEDLLHERHLSGIWKGHSLGRPILGTNETLATFNRPRIIRFVRRTYDPHQMVISVAGQFSVAETLSQLSRAFGAYTAPQSDLIPREAPVLKAHYQVQWRKLEQVHLCLGMPGLPQGHPDRFTLYVLNAILGGSVSSRLFQEVREKSGLAYTICSSPSFYQDTGILTVYAGAGPAHAPRVLQLTLREIKKLRNNGVDTAELERAKKHVTGSMMLGMENMNSRMGTLAKNELYFGRAFTLDQVVRAIQGVSVKDLMQLSATIFDEKRLSLTALGPIRATDLPELRL